jgi:hypothetical protein
MYGYVDSVVILSDGRVVIEDTVWRPGLFLSRRLDAAGLAFVNAQVTAVGLFDRSQYREVVHPTEAGTGVGADQITLVSGGRKILVYEGSAPTGSFASSSKWDRFDKLLAHLGKPDGWIPSTGWSDAAWEPFHPATYCLALRRRLPGPAPLHGADLAWPAGARPFAAFGQSAIPGQDPDDRLGIIDAPAAYKLAASIATSATAASVPPDDSDFVSLNQGGRMTSPLIDDPDGGDPITAVIWPVSPGVTACPAQS